MAWRDLHKNNQTHGESVEGPTRLYRTWQHMRSRCMNKDNDSFANYGGRGITICSEWDSFENFRDDMGNPSSPEHTIDRIDNDKGYSKSNCRWANATTQGRNKRNNRVIEYQGEMKTVMEWHEVTGIPYTTLLNRLRKKAPVEKIMASGKFTRGGLK